MPGRFILFFCLFFISLNLGAQVVRIRLIENKEYCAGFEPSNTAQVKISALPNIRIPENAGTVYTWYAVHREGFRSWHTPIDQRAIPLPWPGRYEIYVVMKYIDKITLKPYFAFKSSSIFVTADACIP
ncbi:MAG: hypothetical protein EBS35_02825 [Bacteroidetes bacterium]|nr:hypothetical protein [Bacteroidota bacterium]